MDILVDNLLSALFSRYCGANDVATATDNLEVGGGVCDRFLKSEFGWVCVSIAIEYYQHLYVVLVCVHVYICPTM
ncbi:hypothetical protein EON65_33225 [archaeon]|nr:MAG: hypothetical protein EON65_33225 [archaeon]